MSSIPIVEGHPVGAAAYKSDGAATSYQAAPTDYSQLDTTVATPDLRMNPPKQFRDVIWAVLFIGHLVAMVAICALGIASGEGGGGANNAMLNPAIISLVCVGGLAAVGLSTATLTFMMYQTELLIKIALIFSVLCSLAFAVFGFMTGSMMMGGLGLLSFAIGCCYAKVAWKRIPFAASNLRTALTAVSSNLGLGVIAYFFTALALGWSILWFTGLGSALAGGNSMVVVFLLFLSFYWVHQVLQNTMHVTTAGVVGTWWFNPAEASSFCSSAICSSVTRATTYSFGSICFGSFVVAVVKALRALESYSRGQEDMQFLQCIIQCILACIESILEYFNKWAYVYVGLYGFSYLDAGRNVLELFKNRGWTAIVSDDLCDNVLFMMSVGIGVASGLIGLLFGASSGDMFADMGFESSIGPAFFVGFLTGFLFSTVLLSVVSSAVNTVIVCYAEAPAEFQMNHPELSADMRGAWTEAYPGMPL